MNTKIIAIINHKGGVGKTTSTLNLGKALSILGKKILLIDIDPQANLSQSVGLENPDRSVYEVLCKGEKPPIQKIADNFSIIPSELSLSTAEIELQAEQVTGYFKLREALEPLEKEYDYILIDCPPSLGILTVNALLASSHILIVVEPQFLAIKGLQTILELFEKLKKTLNRNLDILGLLITQFNRTVVSKNIIEQLREKYKDKVLESIIRQSVKITEASATKKDIFTYDDTCSGAEDYLILAKEIIEKK
ncbi:MAG: ParA family protein [Raineya sp.]|jgi:chromosome partitioning protein|nr:ParA family protein [Raineya sp.]